MKKEKSDREQLFRPVEPWILRAKNSALEELMRPCGRFQSPLSVEELLRMRVARFADTFDLLRDNTTTFAPSLPLNWQFLLKYLCDAGVISDPYVQFAGFRNDEPKTFSCQLNATLGKDITDGHRNEQGGGASTSSLEETISKATGELLERHFLGVYRREALPAFSYAALAKRRSALNPSHLNGYLQWQKELSPRFAYDEYKPLRWVKGLEIATGKSALLPAQLAFWNYDYTADQKEPVLGNSTTNGCAGHFTKEEAILSSLLEIIQRDGFLIYWLNSISPNVIDVANTGDDEVGELLARCERYRLQIYFLNTTSDIGVPSATCAVIDTAGEEPLISIGGGTGFTLKETLLASAREALSVYSFTSRMSPIRLPKGYKPFSDSSLGRTERLLLWRGKEMLKHFEFFISGPRQTPDEFVADAAARTSVPGKLAYVLHTLGAKGYQTYLYEVRHKVLDALGYHVVRAIVPQLLPLYLYEHAAT
ncbi:MAG: YcaO-like family protein, partial [Patescibacteria group bacterium]|nr:YcaO-like family protein [Patescibacteria group bacterium]